MVAVRAAEALMARDFLRSFALVAGVNSTRDVNNRHCTNNVLS